MSQRETTMVREYPDSKAADTDAQQLAQSGWEIASTVNADQNQSIVQRILKRKKTPIVVTYRRQVI